MILKDIWEGNDCSCQGSKWNFILSLTLNPLHIPKILHVFVFCQKNLAEVSLAVLSFPVLYATSLLPTFYILFLKIYYIFESLLWIFISMYLCILYKYWVPLYFISLDNVICSPPLSHYCLFLVLLLVLFFLSNSTLSIFTYCFGNLAFTNEGKNAIFTFQTLVYFVQHNGPVQGMNAVLKLLLWKIPFVLLTVTFDKSALKTQFIILLVQFILLIGRNESFLSSFTLQMVIPG